MKRSTILLIGLLILDVFLAAAVPAYAGKNKEVRLKLINKTDHDVNLQLSGDKFYYFTVPAKTANTYHIVKGMYNRQTWACGATSVGTLDMRSQVKLNFIPCERTAPNQGEPSQEKVSLYDSPWGPRHHYQDGTYYIPGAAD